MTRCTVYRSSRTRYTYVFVREDLDLGDLPVELVDLLGEPEAIMELDLDEREALAKEDIDKVRRNVRDPGYHVQLPPEEDESGWLDLPPRTS